MTTEEFSSLCVKYERLVYTVCFQLVRDHSLAEDLTQDTFLSAYLHKDACPKEQYKPWLVRIASNKAKDVLKSAYHSRVIKDETILAPMESKEKSPEQSAIEKEGETAVHEAIKTLRPPYDEVAKLALIDELSVEEISVKLDRPVKTVYTQLYRAKKELQENLKERRQKNV